MAFDIAAMVDKAKATAQRQQFEFIPIGKLRPDPENFYSVEGIESLASNIAENGLLDPITVYIDKDFPDVFTILSGHRRHSALQLLAAEDAEKWGAVPCIVDREDLPKAARKLRLMMANCDTRRMTSADIDTQAREMEKCIEDLQAQGYTFSGRKSEYVAKALNTSKTKLNKLKVIREGLIDSWMALWKKGEATDELCYKLAHQDKELQHRLFARYGTQPRRLYAWQVDEYADALKKIPTECSHGFAVCLNGRQETDKIISSADPAHCGCGRCCCGCPNLERCGHNCNKAEAEKKALRAATKEQKTEKAAKEAAHDAPIIAATAGFIRRMVQAAREKEISGKDVAKAAGRWDWDKDWTAIADGAKEPKASSDIPIGYSITGAALVHLQDLAALLGVSIDYLVTGKEPEKKCPESGQVWNPGEPDEEGFYVLAYRDKCGGRSYYERARFDASRGWLLYGSELTDSGFVPVGWVKEAE